MEKWVVTTKGADYREIGKKFQIDPVIARLIRNRGILGDEKIQKYLYGRIEDIPSPWLFEGYGEGGRADLEKDSGGRTYSHYRRL